MQRHSLSTTLLILLLILPALGCNFITSVIAKPTATSTQTETSTLPPPTETFTPEPPTAEPATATLTILETSTLAPDTLENTVAPTLAAIVPEAGVKFVGSFDGGLLSFRISSNSNAVIPKTLNFKKAACKEGGTISDLQAFDPPPSFLIDKGKFTISRDTLLWTGFFTTPRQARGSVEIKLKKGGSNCTIGPIAWIAEAE